MRYQAVKENRGDYYAKYKPITSGGFAYLDLIFLHQYEVARVADVMEEELHLWLSRYPIPIMVSSYDNKDDNILVDSVRSSNFLFGFIDTKTNKTCMYWQQTTNNYFPKEQLEESYIQRVYKDLTFKTLEEINTQNKENQQNIIRIKRGWTIIAFYFVIAPIIIYFIGFASPIFGLLVFLYSLWKGIEKWLKLTGRWKKSKKEVQKEEENNRIKHHHHHCELNPEGFKKLRAENFEIIAQKRIQSEVKEVDNDFFEGE